PQGNVTQAGHKHVPNRNSPFLTVSSRSNRAEGFAAAPQGNVTQAGHKHVPNQNPPFPNATNTINSGEAEQ
ncbi:hypothetical protein, partial [Actinophytocola sp.]|uniref:hypothetical protein n=1 Tax=Actinophytocola sp. TaxID=1872138 RepID=UPI003D6B0C55